MRNVCMFLCTGAVTVLAIGCQRADAAPAGREELNPGVAWLVGGWDCQTTYEAITDFPPFIRSPFRAHSARGLWVIDPNSDRTGVISSYVEYEADAGHPLYSSELSIRVARPSTDRTAVLTEIGYDDGDGELIVGAAGRVFAPSRFLTGAVMVSGRLVSNDTVGDPESGFRWTANWSGNALEGAQTTELLAPFHLRQTEGTQGTRRFATRRCVRVSVN
jgi:hypothetical protein